VISPATRKALGILVDYGDNRDVRRERRDM